MMINDFFRIGELISVHIQKSELERKEAELATPMLTDLEHIPQIFEWFCDYLVIVEMEVNLILIEKCNFLLSSCSFIPL